MDSEHLDYYKTLNNLQDKVHFYIKKLNKNNTKIFLNGDDPFLKKINLKNVIKFGFNPNNNLIIKNLKLSNKNIKFNIISNTYENLNNIKSNLLGEHNAYNVTAICGVLNELGIKINHNDFMTFLGIERRMNQIGTIKTSLFIDDYAHHPLEIDKLISVLKLFNQKNKFLILEPHRLSRLNQLYDDYLKVLLGVSNLIVLETYSAGESLKKKWKNSKDLVNDINTAKTKKAMYISSYEELFVFFDETINKSKNNLFVCAGAGILSKEIKVYYESRKYRIRKT